jgi:ribonuclease P protein component
VFAQAKPSRDKYFTVLLRDNEGEGPRLGIITAKRKLPRAVGRNRAKRIIRESFRQNRANLGDVDVIVLAQATAGGAENRVLFDSLERHWRRCQELAGRD